MTKIDQNFTVQKKVVMENVLDSLFNVFKESINQTNNDQRYWIEKLKQHNEIGDALSGYLKELTETMSSSNDDKDSDACKESWRLLLKEQQRNLITLSEVIGAYIKTTSLMLKQIDKE